MISPASQWFSRDRVATAILLIGTLSACVGAAREPVESLTTLGGGETLVVGRVELVPPLSKDEQKIKGLGTGGFENKIFLIIDDRYRVLKAEPVVADFTGRIEALLGKNFFVRSDSKPFFVIAGMLYVELGGSEMNRAYFPGGLKASLKPGDKAVYIGTIQYHRNEFFDVTKVAVVDDYENVNAEFKKKFGTRNTLRKALLTQVK
jgi:hypothetical protein